MKRSAGPAGKRRSARGHTGKRVPQKKIVDPIVAGAERGSIAFEEIIDQAKRVRGVDLKPASLKSFLSRMKTEGIYEQREDGRWRLCAPPSSRAAEE